MYPYDEQKYQNQPQNLNQDSNMAGANDTTEKKGTETFYASPFHPQQGQNPDSPYSGSPYRQGPEMKNWNYSYHTTAKAAVKEKKDRRALKFAACALAILLIAMGGGYLGSVIGNQTNGITGASNNGGSTLVQTSNGYDQQEATMVEQVAAATANSVVEITTESVTTGNYFQQQIVSGAGSGVIISADGYIVTNNHVIADASRITVTLRDGSQYEATLVGTDPKTDIAVIKVDATGLSPAVMGTSGDLNVGEPAIVIGNPLGQLGGTVTNGIISALDRQITLDGQVMTLLQTNAAINPGNSGGGLFNQNGELVGIVNAKSGNTTGENVSIEGLGFAIPIDIAKPVIEDLMQYGYVQGRIDLGMTLIDIDDAMTAMMYRLDSTGVYVLQVTDGSNAQQAGIQSGDRIVTVNGTEVSTESEINAILDDLQVGDQITIELERSGRMGVTSFTLQEQTGNGLSL